MKSLRQFWAFLDQRPSTRAVLREWQRECGECFDAVEPLLTPTGTLATSYPAPRDGDPPLRVVHRGKDIVAVCDEARSPRVALTQPDLVLYRVDMARLRAAMCDGLDLKPARAGLSEFPGVLRVGAWSPQPSATFPVVLCALGERDCLRRALRDLFLDEKKPLIVLTPTDVRPDGAIDDLAAEQKCTLVPTAEVLMDDKGRWVATEEWSRFQGTFLKRAGITLPSSFTNNKKPTKRASRAATLDALKDVLREHLRAARDHAWATTRTGEPELLPRPTQAALAVQLKVSESTVSRSLRDSKDMELPILWKTAEDIDAVRAYRG
jgi:hypothetical protein